MIRLYSNENFPLQVVKELRSYGYDVLTIQETGQSGVSLPDEEVLKFAAEEGRALLTLNRKHFIRLHKENSDHAGIIVCSFDPNFIAQAQRIRKEIESQVQLSGQLIRVNRPLEKPVK
jgi:uncharacterized protein with PIN domain